MKRWIKVSVLLVLAAVAGLLGYGVFLYQEIRASAVTDEARKADVIVILGAAQYNGKPSPVLRARLDHGCALFNQGLARTIVTSGGFGPDPNFSEAHVATQFLIQRGVDPDRIITEQSGGSTFETIHSVARMMRAKGWSTAIVVSDGFHLYRLKRMFADYGVTAYTSPAPDSPIEVSSSPRFWHSMREVVLFSAYRWMNL